VSFPVIADESFGTSGYLTSHPLDLPANIASGDLLLALVLFHSNGNSGSITLPGGWTQLGSTATVNESGGAVAMAFVMYRWADGSEGSTATVTTSAVHQKKYWIGRITGADTGTDPEMSAPGVGNQFTTPNPSSLAPSWGAADNLWLATAFVSKASGSFSGASVPSGYTAVHDEDNGSYYLVVTSLDLNASSEDPGAFTGAGAFVAPTLAVKPGAVAQDWTGAASLPLSADATAAGTRVFSGAAPASLAATATAAGDVEVTRQRARPESDVDAGGWADEPLYTSLSDQDAATSVTATAS